MENLESQDQLLSLLCLDPIFHLSFECSTVVNSL